MDFLRIESTLFYGAIGLYLASMIMYFIFFVSKTEKAGNIGSFIIKIGFGLHTLALISRGIGAGRVPLTNQYEFATSFAWGIALCFIIFENKYSFRAMGTFVVPIIFLIIGYAAMQNKDVRPLMPALQSKWLAIHVSLAILSYGSFGVAAGVSCMYLLRNKFSKDDFISKHVPSLDKLDALSYRAISLGFLLLTLVIITGAIWAESAWGRYWAWDPKETWSLITWIIYAIYLHMRISKGWKGKKAAIFSVIGFICVLFTYIGVNTLIPSIHSYALVGDSTLCI
ncbi:c-type cytochrome biogenesis protein CcsB [Tissierella carlieri]|jgi:cytochrome c-type biogenesis protein CcsB|uniref:c-type cytochrome biogenesis protein CcsB n=1 Tax=Tissierella TaxID=41273 RepID=UPI000BA09555|nr:MULTISPECIES: c-type cytochrome biogenesis protein CcsB [Tissierella]MBU5312102.1 c-type cytochrome biogenesis protein CcsB [Tissierella carlieri]MDU5080984.1 c-type cytochrome biogenesis protein CcsB [Bacillota bacterium]OZV11955.1 c-type cytochrome biogenesis protein CcsB [Tissierella sp. P1]